MNLNNTKRSMVTLAALLLVLFSLPTLADPTQIQKLIADGELEQALDMTEAELENDGSNVSYRFLQGLILTRLNKLEQARDVFVALTQSNPDLPEPYNNLAVIYASMGDYDKARQALEQAINTHPAYATAHENLGDIYAKLASQAYNQALELDNNNTTAKTKLSLVNELFSAPASVGEQPVQLAEAQAAEKEAAKREAERQELARLEAAKLEAERQELAKQEAAKREAEQQELARLEAAKLEAERQELAKQEAAKREAEQQELARMEAAKQEAAKREAERQELARLEAAKLEAERQEQAKAEAARQEAARLEAERQEATRREVAKQEAARQEAIRKQEAERLQVENQASTEVNQALIPAIKQAVIDWSDVWSARNISAYLAAYANDFIPPEGRSLESWRQLRQKRLSDSGTIKVSIADLVVELTGTDRAQATFTQAYQSAIYSDRVKKTLLLKQEGNKWLITRELTR